MPTIPITLIKGDKVSNLTDYRDALPVNMYAIEREVLGAKGYLLTYPGLTSFGTGSGIDRGALYNEREEKHFRVSGINLISVSPTGVVTNLGAISGTEQVAMPYSFNTQCIIADGKMFLYSTAGGFAEVVDADLGDPIDGVWIDGYYFLTDGEYIYHTDLADETAIDPLKYATAEFMPDPSLGVAKTSDNKVMVFGRYTTEFFANNASENFAFQRLESRAQKLGIVATHAKCEVGGNFYIVGGPKEESVSVHVLISGTFKRIATREIEKILAQYTEPELADIRVETYTKDTTTFVLIHLPNEVLCFNESIAKILGLQYAWSILKTDTIGDNPYRAINGVFDAKNSLWIYGDKTDTNIGKLDDSVVTHYGEKVEWILYSPFLNLERASINKVEITTIPGFNIADDASVAISLTKNGLTYGTEYWLNYGSPLAYDNRFIYRRLGYVSDFVGFKFRGISTSKMAFGLMKLDYS
jgi:hypothetical protein